MTHAFPDHPFLRGNYAPLRAEMDAPDLVVEGELPDALRGTFYRNGPNPLYPPRDAYHYFSGDGMVHAFTFVDGRVTYRNRWVRTAKWQAEADAGEALFGTLGNPLTTDERARGIRFNVANTHIVSHAGRLLALEEGSPPFELDAETLRSVGSYDYEGKLPGPMTAHPKRDPETNELHFFAYGLDGFGTPALGYYVADASGVLIRADRFDAPYSAMVHDFALTENHVIFPIFPATIDVGRAMRGGPPIGWDANLPSYLGILRRGDPIESVRWVTGDASFVFHPMNAYDDGDRLVLDMHRYAAAPGFPGVDGSRPRGADAEAFLERWTVPHASESDTWTTERLDDRPTEFPRTDDRAVARPYRHGFAAASIRGTARWTVFESLVHYDLTRGTSDIWSVPDGDCVCEPAFVQRSPESDEGDGWLITLVYRAATHTSEVAILDTRDITAGPIATAKMDSRVPNGFHGSWVAA